MDGMPSLGGPPEMISEYSTDFLLKSVAGHSNFQNSGLAEAAAAVKATRAPARTLETAIRRARARICRGVLLMGGNVGPP